MTTPTDDEITFAAMFAGIKPADRKEARDARITKEKRAQLSDKQLRRGAVRTTQINFRCSPAFKAKVDMVKAKLGDDWSVADVMEAALDVFAESKGINE